MTTLYITGAGVSKDSGIPTFRGHDGVWTIGSHHYTPQEMATRAMYLNDPAQFLLWYFKRFATYRHVRPNAVHSWLAARCNARTAGAPTARLITQNIDGLDGKAGNEDYISIHGRLDKMTHLHDQAQFDTRTIGGHATLPLLDAPWDEVMAACGVTPAGTDAPAGTDGTAGTAGTDTPASDTLASDVDDATLTAALLRACRVDGRPQMDVSLKPYVLLFDEYYTDLYRMTEAEQWMQEATRMVFMGTSFSVNITMIALRTALQRRLPIVVVDPDPVDIAATFGIPPGMADITYHAMTAQDWIKSQD